MFNNVILVGYLGSDAESRPTRNNSTLTGPFTRDQAYLEKPPDRRT
jgi:single-stranded DNA-binding protein